MSDQTIADLERQLAEACAETDTVERQLALLQKQYAIAEGQATSRAVSVEEKRLRIADLERQLVEMRKVLKPFAKVGANFGTETDSCIEDEASVLEATEHTCGFVGDLTVGDFRRADAAAPGSANRPA